MLPSANRNTWKWKMFRLICALLFDIFFEGVGWGGGREDIMYQNWKKQILSTFKPLSTIFLLGGALKLLICYSWDPHLIASRNIVWITFHCETFFFFSDISEQNNDYSDTLDFRRGWVEEVGMVTFRVLEVPDYESATLIYFYIYTQVSQTSGVALCKRRF